MDIARLSRRYGRYLRLVKRIKAEIESRFPHRQIVVHENDDWLNVNFLSSAPGEIFRIYRYREWIRLFDRTACRIGDKDLDTIGLVDLESEYDDDRLIEDFFYIFEPTLKEAIIRQKRWWEVQKIKIAADDSLDFEDEE